MHLFRWFGPGDVPACLDLRAQGWKLLPASSADPHVMLADCTRMPASRWLELIAIPRIDRATVLVIGIRDGEERARLLRLGFGDAAGANPVVDEVEWRARRILSLRLMLPRLRSHEALLLDLVARDGYVAGRAVGLFPREFEVLWRLADTPGEAVTRDQLLREVWRLEHLPETNSLAVHISRMRAKLAIAGVGGIVETLPGGSYRLTPAKERPAVPLATPPNDLALYLHETIGEETISAAEREAHEAGIPPQ